MEHIVNFGISFDDETLTKRIEENAYKDIISELKFGLENKIHEKLRKSYYSDPLMDIVKEQVNEVIETKKEEIIERAVAQVADKIYRSKRVKEAIGELLLKEVEK